MQIYEETNLSVKNIRVNKPEKAFSKWIDTKGDILWKECTVLKYNEESKLYTIVWRDNKAQK